MTRALITGGAGFIGLHLARHLLARGVQVDIVDNFSRGARDSELESTVESGGIQIFDCDLAEPGVLSDLDTDYRCIVHLAAIVGVSRVTRRSYAVLTDNMAMTRNAIDAARRQTRLDRFVFISTSEVYAGTMEYSALPLPTPEDALLTLADLSQPRTSYSLSKIYGEAMCQQAGIGFTILRPHNVYGPRMGLSHVVPELLQRAHAAPDGGSLKVFSAEHSRTFCYVEDAVEMIWRATQSPRCEGEVLNIGTQAPELRMSELATIVCGVVGKTLEIVHLPPTPGSPSRRCPDMTKASSLTMYTARVGLVEGLQKTYDWYLARGFRSADGDDLTVSASERP